MADESLGRHLVRGVVGFGALAGAVALVPVIGFASLVLVLVLVLAPVGLVALRGCPACWFMGLAQTLSRGRLERSCEGGVCELTVAARPADPGAVCRDSPLR
ncbi:hypothetical protein [Actinomadura sp. NTSP31]|uniref:hypothetical protein n=1 Tax=Actinomadura sp. NTSP31 TaxID=1735447 RepID=UPI0035BED561